MHVYFLLGPTLKRSPIIVPFTFKKGTKYIERNQGFKTGKHISDIKESTRSLSKEWSWPVYQAQAMQEQLVAEIPWW